STPNNQDTGRGELVRVEEAESVHEGVVLVNPKLDEENGLADWLEDEDEIEIGGGTAHTGTTSSTVVEKPSVGALLAESAKEQADRSSVVVPTLVAVTERKDEGCVKQGLAPASALTTALESAPSSATSCPHTPLLARSPELGPVPDQTSGSSPIKFLDLFGHISTRGSASTPSAAPAPAPTHGPDSGTTVTLTPIDVPALSSLCPPTPVTTASPSPVDATTLGSAAVVSPAAGLPLASAPAPPFDLDLVPSALALASTSGLPAPAPSPNPTASPDPTLGPAPSPVATQPSASALESELAPDPHNPDPGLSALVPARPSNARFDFTGGSDDSSAHEPTQFPVPRSTAAPPSEHQPQAEPTPIRVVPTDPKQEHSTEHSPMRRQVEAHVEMSGAIAPVDGVGSVNSGQSKHESRNEPEPVNMQRTTSNQGGKCAEWFSRCDDDIKGQPSTSGAATPTVGAGSKRKDEVLVKLNSDAVPVTPSVLPAAPFLEPGSATSPSPVSTSTAAPAQVPCPPSRPTPAAASKFAPILDHSSGPVLETILLPESPHLLRFKLPILPPLTHEPEFGSAAANDLASATAPASIQSPGPGPAHISDPVLDPAPASSPTPAPVRDSNLTSEPVPESVPAPAPAAAPVPVLASVPESAACSTPDTARPPAFAFAPVPAQSSTVSTPAAAPDVAPTPSIEPISALDQAPVSVRHSIPLPVARTTSDVPLAPQNPAPSDNANDNIPAETLVPHPQPSMPAEDTPHSDANLMNQI
ncbi:hypothetical protein FRC06_007470, partial [Ceratobasidium sp. 370]